VLVRPRPIIATALTAASAALVLAGCGKDSSSTAAAPGPGRGANAAYVQCLRRHGVNLPTAYPSGFRRGPRPSGFPTRPTARPSGAPGGRYPGFGMSPPPGVDQATWQKAQQACANLRPTARPGTGYGVRHPDAAYRNCLRDHGVDPGQLAGTDPKTSAALAACKVLSPSPTPTPST
jgi:hypothetical protein